MNKTIGLFAHVDAGKTTFAESVLYVTKTLKKRGRVDHQDTLLDYHDIERARGITIFSDIAKFQYEDSTYYLVDTPGHVDFSYEMEKAISIMDAAIVIVSAVDGVQAHTKTVWRLLREANIPTVIFINKMDREGVEIEAVIKELTSALSPNCYMMDFENEAWIEQLAELDETLMETYFETGYEEALWNQVGRDLFLNGKAFPTFKG
ncbi:MAG TPA: elongation factor G, partial [Firmicutes bacterium]|nr:elongation factor G [Bacillota bacterium]